GVNRDPADIYQAIAQFALSAAQLEVHGNIVRDLATLVLTRRPTLERRAQQVAEEQNAVSEQYRLMLQNFVAHKAQLRQRKEYLQSKSRQREARAIRVPENDQALRDELQERRCAAFRTRALLVFVCLQGVLQQIAQRDRYTRRLFLKTQ